MLTECIESTLTKIHKYLQICLKHVVQQFFQRKCTLFLVPVKSEAITQQVGHNFKHFKLLLAVAIHVLSNVKSLEDTVIFINNLQ